MAWESFSQEADGSVAATAHDESHWDHSGMLSEQRSS